VVSWQGEGTQAINSLIDLVFFFFGSPVDCHGR
jgi:hypothetical protein